MHVPCRSDQVSLFLGNPPKNQKLHAKQIPQSAVYIYTLDMYNNYIARGVEFFPITLLSPAASSQALYGYATVSTESGARKREES